MTVGGRGSPDRTARLAGVLYLSLLPLGFFSFAYVPSVLLVPGDPGATARNIEASEWLFRAATAGHLASQVVVVFLVLALYRLFRGVNGNRAVLMAVLALVGVPVAVLGEAHNLAVPRLLGADEGAFTPAQLQARAMLFLDLGRNGVLLAQIFWGLWMVPLAALVFRSGFLPRLLAVAVLVAGAGYLFDSAAQLLFPGLPTVSRFTVVAELALPLWLLGKGVTVEERSRAAAAEGAV